MSDQDIMNKKVGNKDIPRLEAKDVEVQGTVVRQVGDKKQNILVLMCKHPDKEEVVELTKIRVLRNDKAKAIGLWVTQDEDGNIQKGSGIAELLSVAKVETVSELTGVNLPTIEEGKESSYLCIKGY